VDTQAQTATCPNGQTVPASTVTTHQEGRTAYTFTFERSLCETCPLFTRCVRSKTAGRTIQLGFYENYFQAARQRQETEEFKELYRLRPRIEGKQSELVAHGLRNTRYVGKAKRRLQRLWLAAAINLKRLGKLLEYPNGHTTRPQQAQALWMPAREVKNALLTA
jgi:transposase